MTFLPIEEHGVIGDLHTVALVGVDGTIDFLSWPDFDSPTVFASLLDPERGGHFTICPGIDTTRKQLYLFDTNVLLTRFLSKEGVVELTDFMVPGTDGRPAHVLVRRVTGVRGPVTVAMRCAPRFDYGRGEHRVVRGSGDDNSIVFESKGPDAIALRLRSDVPLQTDDRDATATVTLGPGETTWFVLESAIRKPPDPAEASRLVDEAFHQTVDYWRAWMGRSRYTGRWREIVHRSALVLKLLVSDRHGSLVAAPTFGLPEELGGERNWDYRYTWIRDASFTLYALIRLGYTAEAGAFMGWIEDRCRDIEADGTMQIMYGFDGRKVLTEERLDHLEGYQGSSPVRVGNAAHGQLQLDIYGELMDSIYLYNKHGEPISHDLWENVSRLLEWVCHNWHLEDEGIWEVRGERQAFLYSRLMCWVALDRGIRLATKRSFPAPLDKWTANRDAIYQEILTDFWDEERRTFVQHKGSTTVDASSLLMPLVKFISPTDPRWLSTLEAIEEDLVDDSLVFRYRIGSAAADGLEGNEGTFNMCSFWYAEALARSGQVDKARFVFEKMLGYANHLGLYAEELGPHGEHLGNFPQAFTHLGLISAAYAIDRKLDDEGWVG